MLTATIISIIIIIITVIDECVNIFMEYMFNRALKANSKKSANSD